MGFTQSTSDPCIYTSSKEGLLILAVYVDDIVLAEKSDKDTAEVKSALTKQFQVKDMGELHYFLGVSVKQNPKTGETWIGQPVYTHYMALSSAAQEAIWIRQLTKDLQNGPTRSTVIYEDNQSAICMAKNPQFRGRTKHIEINTTLFERRFWMKL